MLQTRLLFILVKYLGEIPRLTIKNIWVGKYRAWLHKILLLWRLKVGWSIDDLVCMLHKHPVVFQLLEVLGSLLNQGVFVVRKECGDSIVLPFLIVGEPWRTWIKGHSKLFSCSIRLRLGRNKLKVQRWSYIVSCICTGSNLFYNLLLLLLGMLQYSIMSL